MFDKKTMQLAKSLAQDLVIVQEEKERQSIQDTFNYMKSRVMEIWKSIKRTVSAAYETIYGQENECEISKDKPSKNWYVPLKIEAPPMPDIKVPRMLYARSSI